MVENVEILAVDQRLDAPVDNKVDPAQLRSVTLLVTTRQADRLAREQNKGNFHLSLRNPEDAELAPKVPEGRARVEQPVGPPAPDPKLVAREEKPEAPKVIPRVRPRIRTLRGTAWDAVELE